jgi:hypothetical protein
MKIKRGSKGKHKKGHNSSKNCRKIVIIELNLDFHNVHLHSDQERGNEYVPKVYRISSNFDVCFLLNGLDCIEGFR